MDKKYLSKIVQGSDTLYIKDAEAQAAIVDLQASVTGAMHFLGTSTTALSDGLEMVDSDATDGQVVEVTIAGQKYRKAAPGTNDDWKQLKSGDVAVYAVSGKDMEFVYNDVTHKWQEYGSTGSIKALAFQDSASASYTPAGSNSDSAVSFSGTTDSDFVTGYNNDGVAPSFTEGAFTQGTLPSFTEGAFSAGSLPSLGAATTSNFATEGVTASYTENTETLTLSAASTSAAVTAQGTFSAGSLPSKAADTWSAGTLPTKAADTFSAGSAATLATSKAITALGTATAAGQTFTGTGATITVS